METLRRTRNRNPSLKGVNVIHICFCCGAKTNDCVHNGNDIHSNGSVRSCVQHK